MSLRGIAGNQALVERVLQEVSQRPYHTYLLTGPAHIGKSMVAQGLAHSLLCERSPGPQFCCTPENCPVREGRTSAGSRAGTPAAQRCDCCASCVQIAAGVHPDFIYVGRNPKRTEVLIEQVRDLIERLGVRPSRGSRRVAIIDDAEALNIPGQNALLKTLEEPPAHTVIFMISQSERALLETVRSRLRPVRFGPIETAEIAAFLATREIQQDRAAASARLARGSIGRALALANGAEPPTAQLMEALTRARTINFAEAQTLAQKFFGGREEAADNFELIARMLEEMLCFRLLRAELNAPSPEAARMMAEFAQAVDTPTLNTLLAFALEARAAIDSMATPRLQAENWWMNAGAALRGEC